MFPTRMHHTVEHLPDHLLEHPPYNRAMPQQTFFPQSERMMPQMIDPFRNHFLPPHQHYRPVDMAPIFHQQNPNNTLPQMTDQVKGNVFHPQLNYNPSEMINHFQQQHQMHMRQSNDIVQQQQHCRPAEMVPSMPHNLQDMRRNLGNQLPGHFLDQSPHHRAPLMLTYNQDPNLNQRMSFNAGTTPNINFEPTPYLRREQMITYPQPRPENNMMPQMTDPRRDSYCQPQPPNRAVVMAPPQQNLQKMLPQMVNFPRNNIVQQQQHYRPAEMATSSMPQNHQEMRYIQNDQYPGHLIEHSPFSYRAPLMLTYNQDAKPKKMLQIEGPTGNNSVQLKPHYRSAVASSTPQNLQEMSSKLLLKQPPYYRAPLMLTYNEEPQPKKKVPFVVLNSQDNLLISAQLPKDEQRATTEQSFGKLHNTIRYHIDDPKTVIRTPVGRAYRKEELVKDNNKHFSNNQKLLFTKKKVDEHMGVQKTSDFVNTSGLLKPVPSPLPVEEHSNSFVCKICDIKFENEVGLLQHLELHRKHYNQMIEEQDFSSSNSPKASSEEEYVIDLTDNE